MKNEVLYLLLNDAADHEAVFLASANKGKSQIHQQSSGSYIGCRLDKQVRPFALGSGELPPLGIGCCFW